MKVTFHQMKKTSSCSCSYGLHLWGNDTTCWNFCEVQGDHIEKSSAIQLLQQLHSRN